MKKEAFYRPLTILMPIAAVLCATGVSVYEWRRLKHLEAAAAATTTQIARIQTELRSYEAQPQTEKFPTVPKTPREQAQFLDALRANADVSGVQLVRWSNITPGPAPAAPATPDQSAAGASNDVTSIVSIVEVAGVAKDTRQFLYNVVRSRRLLNMGDIKWVRDKWPNTHLTFTLTRYVAPPVALPNGNSPLPGNEAGHGFVTSDRRATNASFTSGATTEGGASPDRMSLPNPMDAPGIAHGSYTSRLEAGVSKLKDIEKSDQSEQSGLTASPRPPAVTNANR